MLLLFECGDAFAFLADFGERAPHVEPHTGEEERRWWLLAAGVRFDREAEAVALTRFYALMKKR